MLHVCHLSQRKWTWALKRNCQIIIFWMNLRHAKLIQTYCEREVYQSEIFVWIRSLMCSWSVSLVSRNPEELQSCFFSIWASGCSCEKIQHMHTHFFSASPHSAAHTKQFKLLGSCWLRLCRHCVVSLSLSHSVRGNQGEAWGEVPPPWDIQHYTLTAMNKAIQKILYVYSK